MTTGYSRKRNSSSDPMVYRPWAGFFPHPELDRDLPPRPRYERVQAALAEQSRELTLRYTIRNDVPRAVLLRERAIKRALTADEAGQILHALQRHVTLDSLTAAPPDGVFNYVRRTALLTPPISIAAFWELEEGIERITGLQVPSVDLNHTWQPILRFLDQRAAELRAMQ